MKLTEEYIDFHPTIHCDHQLKTNTLMYNNGLFIYKRKWIRTVNLLTLRHIDSVEGKEFWRSLV